jgi:hypothetical protein
MLGTVQVPQNAPVAGTERQGDDSDLINLFGTREIEMTAKPLSNKISLTMEPARLQKLLGFAKQIQDDLETDLVPLTDEDRNALPRGMGVRNLDFSHAAFGHGRNHEELVPPYTDIDEMELDLNAVTALRSLLMPLRQSVKLIEDSIDLATAEAYTAGRTIFAMSKTFALAGQHNAQVVADDLASRLPSANRRKGAPIAAIPAPTSTLSTPPASPEPVPPAGA